MYSERGEAAGNTSPEFFVRYKTSRRRAFDCFPVAECASKYEGLKKRSGFLDGLLEVYEMAIIVKTSQPAALLRAIYKAIDEGEVKTWEYDADKDFTHTPTQWRNQAWLTPKIYTGELRFGIIGTKSIALSKVVYGVYHGRFIEMLLTHFDMQFTEATATALFAEPDQR